MKKSTIIALLSTALFSAGVMAQESNEGTAGEAAAEHQEKAAEHMDKAEHMGKADHMGKAAEHKKAAAKKMKKHAKGEKHDATGK